VLHATLELAAEHRLALPHPRADAPTPMPTDPLADERTGLRQIAEHLLTPVASGLFLARDDLARLGRAHELPRGFGSRVIQLDNLLRSAVEHQQLGVLLNSLDALLVERGEALVRLASVLELDARIEPWLAALARTRALVQTLAAQAPGTPIATRIT
jgi:hypothetical protein